MIVERAFNYPGLGQEIVNHAVLKDFSVVQAGAMVIGATYLIGDGARRHRLHAAQSASPLRERPNERHSDVPTSPIAIPMRGARAQDSRRETLRAAPALADVPDPVAVIVFWTICAIFGYRIAPNDPTFQEPTTSCTRRAAPYPFGTDSARPRRALARDRRLAQHDGDRAGRDAARRPSLGTALGLMLGYFGGWFDEIVSRFIDAFLAIPGIIFLIAVITSLGTSVPTLIITIGLAFTPIIARTVRAAVLAEAGQDYVQAAKLRGERAPYILFVEILPNIVPPIIVEATVRLGYAIFTLAGITFLGLGLQPPTPDWSVDITAGFQNLNDTAHDGYYWQVLFPGLAIISICVAVAMLADSLQQVFDR